MILQSEWFDLLQGRPPERLALVTQRGSLNYGALNWYALSIAKKFVLRKWPQGTRLLVAVEDERHALAIVLGALGAALVPVIADVEAPATAALMMAEVGDVGAVIIDETLAERWLLPLPPDAVWKIRPEPESHSISLYSRLLKRTPHAEKPSFFDELRLTSRYSKVATIEDHKAALIFFTSGSTARPKAVEIAHVALRAHLNTLVRHFGYDSKSRLVNLLPWHHADGLVQGPLAMLLAGGTLYRPLQFRVDTVQKLLDRIYAEQITHFVGIPTMLAIMLRLADGLKDAFKDVPLSFIVSTAGHLEKRLWEDFEARFGIPLVNVYGLTETVAGGIFSGPDQATRCIGTLGKPIDCSIRIVTDNGTLAGIDEEGEIRFSGQNIMTRYLNEPDATSAVLKDGWLRTGDIGKQDRDGFIHFVGRSKSVLKCGGHTIQPEEVAAVIRAHPAIADVAVFGRSHIELEQIPIAAVVCNPGALLNAGELLEHCRAHLAPYKIPRHVYFMRGLPYGPSGKIQLPQLIAELQYQSAEVEIGKNVPAQILEIARLTFSNPQITTLDTTPETTPGWDSMGHLEFVFALEEAFGVNFGAADIMKLASLNDALDIVYRLSGHV